MSGRVRSMDSSKAVEALWERVQARDRDGVAGLVVEDAVIEWPVSGERIVGRENYSAVNREYPEGWAIRVLRIVADGDEVVSEVEVPYEGIGVFRAVSFWYVQKGQIVRGREYWQRAPLRHARTKGSRPWPPLRAVPYPLSLVRVDAARTTGSRPCE